MVEKIKLGKTEFLKQLEIEPQYEHDGCVPSIDGWDVEREAWAESIKTAFYENVLGIYEENEQFEEQISYLKDEVKELKNLLKTHIHSGEKVYAEVD